MATLRDISRRRRAVDNIKQITRAMYLVAASKMRRTEEQVRAGRPYAEKLGELLARLADEELVEHPLMEQRQVENSVLVAVSGDRGLAGSYNHNVHRRALQAMEAIGEEAEQVRLITVGRKADEFFRKLGHEPLRSVTALGEEITFLGARGVARDLVDRFLGGEIDEVWVTYTRFHSPVEQEVATVKLLPVGGSTEGGGAGGSGEAGESGSGGPADAGEAEGAAAAVPDHTEMMGYIYEPSAERVLEDLVPKSVEIQMYRYLAESKTSEHAARMQAMKNATDNADELIDELTLMFNRARQASITAEIADIVGGAEALQG